MKTLSLTDLEIYVIKLSLKSQAFKIIALANDPDTPEGFLEDLARAAWAIESIGKKLKP